jgi:TRAP transporter 4TM/12TM fusion protein
MGAAAFLMAEYLNIPYLAVAKAAAIPALLYFCGIFAGVHFEAKKLGLKGLNRKELPRFWRILVEQGELLLPLVGIVWLLISGFSLNKVALGAAGLAIAAALIRPIVIFIVLLLSGRLVRADVPAGANRFATAGSLLGTWVPGGVRAFFGALEKGAKSALGVAVACALAGIIVGVVTKTGLGLKLASSLVSVARGNLLLTMFFTMLTSIILGMGVPTTANYIITSTIAAPALLTLGVIPIAAHLFVFYFGIIADLTPPVALAAYAGAAIARGNPFKTGVTATRLAIGAFILPYIFVTAPQLLLVGATPLGMVQAVLTSLIGMTAISAGLTGFLVKKLNWVERILLVGAGLLLVVPGLVTDLIGIVVLGGIAAFQVLVQGRKKEAT